MPRKNIEDRSEPGAYHVYNRARQGLVFRDDRDRREFLGLVGLYSRRFELGIAVNAFCLMGTHYHLIVWQKARGALCAFMGSLITAYVRYFNKRHRLSGPLFAGPFRARRLATAKQFRWAVGYVHDNHRSGLNYGFSSHGAFLDDAVRPGWLDADAALRVFGGSERYIAFLEDRGERKRLQSEFFDLD